VLHNLLPVHDVTPQKLGDEAARWQDRLSHLPGPFTAVLVGGASGPYRFPPQAAARLGREASQLVRREGGSLLVTTSARTGEAAAGALAAAIAVPSFFHRWQPDAADNPFHAVLGLASRIIVTADSISMLSEAVGTGKPVLLFDIEEGAYAMRRDLDARRIGARGRSVDASAVPPADQPRAAALLARPARGAPPARRLGRRAMAGRSGRALCGRPRRRMGWPGPWLASGRFLAYERRRDTCREALIRCPIPPLRA